MVLLGGMLFGIFLFNEAYPLIADFYGSTSLGQVTIPDLLGISPGLGVLAVVVLALGSFLISERLEARAAATPGGPA